MAIKNKHNGSILPFIGAVGIAVAILALFIGRTIRTNASQQVYFQMMNRAYRVAESGMTMALGQLSVNPSTGTLPTIITLPEGRYRNYAERISVPVINGFYILTTATVTSSGQEYACALHTYASIANIGEYFAAVKDELQVSPGVDARSGRMYGTSITFLGTTNSADPPTHVEKADYVYAAIYDDLVNPQNDTPAGAGAQPSWAAAGIIPNKVCLGPDHNPLSPTYCKDSIGNTVLPNQLANPMQFPPLSAADFQRYQTLSGLHQLSGTGNWLDFRSMSHIFPPGYRTPGGTPDPNDQYDNVVLAPLPGRENGSNSNVRHVFYSEGGMRVGKTNGGTTVHGQVLFAAKGDIEIYGDIRSATDPTMPGDGYVSSSTAHQAVFLAGGNIVIKTNGVNLGANSTRHIEAFLYCPEDSLVVEDTPNAETLNRHFEFEGSFILGTFAPPRFNLPTQFTGSRTYSYMTTLKTHPPPYMPALSEIYYMLEEIKKSPGLNF